MSNYLYGRVFGLDRISRCKDGVRIECSFFGPESPFGSSYTWVTFEKEADNRWKIVEVWNTRTDKRTDGSEYGARTYTDEEIKSFHKYNEVRFLVPRYDEAGNPMMLRLADDGSGQIAENEITYQMLDLLKEVDRNPRTTISAGWEQNGICVNITHNNRTYYTYLPMSYDEFNKTYGYYISSWNFYL
jgi:hypothetical protein